MARRDATRKAEILAARMSGKTPLEIAKELGVSLRTVYHHLGGRGVQPRKRRSDSGRSRNGIDKTTWDTLLHLVHPRRGKGYGVEEALRVLAAQQPPLPDAEKLTVSWVNEQLRQMQTTKRQMKKTGPGAFVRRERTRANVCHQADATRLCLFYMDLRGDIFYDPPSKLHKERLAAGKTMIDVFGLIDEHSRAGYLRGYAGGECQENWLDFLYHAWSRKSDPEHNPFCGVPTMLYSDMGGGLTGRTTARALAEIGVTAICHMPGKPWKKGKIERFLQTFQQLCEVELRDRTFGSLDELNLWLEEKSVYLGNRQHGTVGEPAFSRWSRSIGEQARGVVAVPTWEEWQRLSLREAEGVLVGRDFVIKFEGEKIEVPRTELWLAYVGHKIRILYRPNGAADEPVLAVLPPLPALALAGCEVRVARVRPGTMPAGFAQETNLVTPGRLRLQQALDAEIPELDLSAHQRAMEQSYPVPMVGRKITVVNDDLFLARPLTQMQAVAEGQRRGVLASPLSDSAADQAFMQHLVPEGTTIDEAELSRALDDYARGKRNAAIDSPVNRSATAGL